MDTGHRTIIATVVGLLLTLLLMTVIGWLVTPTDTKQRQITGAHRTAKTLRRVTTRVYRKRQDIARAVTQPQRPDDQPLKRPPEEKKKKKKLLKDKLDGQIVETARPETEEAPQVAKYLGRYDMKVKVEQKSRGHKRAH